MFASEGELDLRIGWYSGELPLNEMLLGDADGLAQHLLLSGRVTATSSYQDPLAMGAGLRAHLVRTVRSVSLDATNSYLARGGRLIATTYQGSRDESGMVFHREAVLVLGHPEPDAL